MLRQAVRSNGFQIDGWLVGISIDNVSTFAGADWENYTTFNPDPDRRVSHPHNYDPRGLIRMQAWALKRFYVWPR